MNGLGILSRALSFPAVPDVYGNMWQYHPRSDRHSKVGCWAILFDLLQTSRALSRQVERGEVMFGINHTMNDWSTGRQKNLDLVLCQPGGEGGRGESFKGLIKKYGLRLTASDRKTLKGLPDIRRAPVGPVYLALEAKACMTAHIRALPRLYDELNSSHLTMHGDTDRAIAVGFAMVNLAASFVSPDLNRRPGSSGPWVISKHGQPSDAVRTVAKLKEIPRRNGPGNNGFDALGIVLVEMQNDGGPCSIVKERPSPSPDEPFEYSQMIKRVAHLYDTSFG